MSKTQKDPTSSPSLEMGPTPLQEQYRVEDGSLYVVRTQHGIDRILKWNQEAAENTPRGFGGEAAWRHVGRIPFVIAEIWAAECGEGIGTPAFAAYVKKKLQDPDFKKLLVKGY